MYVAHSGITDLLGLLVGERQEPPLSSLFSGLNTVTMIEVGRLTFPRCALISYISSNTYDKTLPQSAFRGPDH